MKTRITIALLFFAIVSQAQVQRLSLKDALKYALENKADAKKAKLEVENANYQIAEARSAALPKINFDANITNNPIIQQTAFSAGGVTTIVSLGQKWTSGASVGLTQNIFNQAVFTGLRAAKTTREFYIINQQLTEEQLIEKVSNNYYQVYVDRQKLSIIESNLVNTTKVKEIIKGQFDNGLAKKIDLDRISVKVSNLEASRQQLINAVQLQENTLKFFIGMPIETKIELPNENFDVSATAFETTTDLNKRTELALLKKQEQLLNFQRKAVIAEYYPTLSLVANYGYQGFGSEIPWFKRPDAAFWTDYANIGLNLRIPIFNGLGTKAKVNKATIELEKIGEDIKDTELALNYGFENAKTQMSNSVINIKNQKENTTLAQEVLENTKNNYSNGLATLTDLLDAENALTEAQNNYTTALLEYKMAEIQIIKSKGELKSLLNQ